MRRLALLALALPLLSGCGSLGGGWTGYAPLGHRVTTVYPDAPRNPVPFWVERERLPHDAIPGAKLFAVAGCTVCHTYVGSGRSELGAPDLTSIGKRHLGIAIEIAHLKCPSCVNPGSPMPKFASLGPKRLRELAIFLEASKGTH